MGALFMMTITDNYTQPVSGIISVLVSHYIIYMKVIPCYESLHSKNPQSLCPNLLFSLLRRLGLSKLFNVTTKWSDCIIYN